MSNCRVTDHRMLLAAGLAVALAAGCGGGSDTPGPPELLQITAGNQVAVAGATAANFTGLDALRDTGAVGASSAARPAAVDGSTKRALGKVFATASRSYPLAVISGTVPCASGGLIAISLDDRDNSQGPSAGDVLTATFNNCREDPFSQIKGEFAVDISDYAEPMISGLFRFSQLTLEAPEGTIAVDGRASIAYATSLDSAGTSTTRVDMKVPAAGLVSTVETTGYKETFTYDAEFGATWNDVTPAAAPGYSTAALNGRVSFASLGKVLLATDPPFREVWEQGGPLSGAVLITGHQSRLRVSVLNTTNARLELDANNDGTFESTRDIPWSELLPF